ncbi:helix-turn-helix domain-containing protein (plasmid) [Streptosporangium sp. CA-135522]|uniref:helix-turn-helix domain-containing protein n=1 Tax=Streptosporangium sp. CA-135522 TaxID=3240072 RepID=UPI003D8EC592
MAKRPGIVMICRDRAGSYADGARRGAPDAVEVADRWRLWANLGAAVDKTVSAHATCLPEPSLEDHHGPDEQPSEAGLPPQLDSPIEYSLARRHRERHAAIHELLAAGRSRAETARELGISERTVYRFAGAPLEQYLGKANHRASRLDRFMDHLHQRFADGLRNATALHHEIQLLGWRGSLRTVERYVARLRERTNPPPTAPTPPKPRKVAGLDHVRPRPPVRGHRRAAQEHSRALPRAGGYASARRQLRQHDPEPCRQQATGLDRRRP